MRQIEIGDGIELVNDEIACPACGCIRNDRSSEASDEGEEECENCGKKYSWERNMSTKYFTEIIN